MDVKVLVAYVGEYISPKTIEDFADHPTVQWLHRNTEAVLECETYTTPMHYTNYSFLIHAIMDDQDYLVYRLWKDSCG